MRLILITLSILLLSSCSSLKSNNTQELNRVVSQAETKAEVELSHEYNIENKHYVVKMCFYGNQRPEVATHSTAILTVVYELAPEEARPELANYISSLCNWIDNFDDVIIKKETK